MAMELEYRIMAKIGFMGQHYTWHNGSYGCRATAQKAVDTIQSECEKYGLTVHHSWMEYVREAYRADTSGGRVTRLTNTWEACSYAIADAIHRKEGGGSDAPNLDDVANGVGWYSWYFWNDTEREQYQREYFSRKNFGSRRYGSVIDLFDFQ